MATGGVPLGRAPLGQQQSPGGLRGRGVPPPPPPPPPAPAPVPHAPAASSATTYPLQPKAAGGSGPPNGPPNDPGGSSSQGASGHQGQGGNLSQEEEPQDLLVQEVGHPLHQGGSKEAAPHHSRQEEQGFQAVLHNHLQGYHSLIAIQTHGLH